MVNKDYHYSLGKNIANRKLS